MSKLNHAEIKEELTTLLKERKRGEELSEDFSAKLKTLKEQCEAEDYNKAFAEVMGERTSGVAEAVTKLVSRGRGRPKKDETEKARHAINMRLTDAQIDTLRRHYGERSPGRVCKHIIKKHIESLEAQELETNTK